MKTREIKFRAWDKFNQKMTYQKNNSPTQRILFFREMLDYEHSGNGIEYMQFTGLYDKNGKEIYEGDIVMIDHWKSSDLFNYSKPFVVEYYKGEINFKQGDYNNFKGSLQGRFDIEVIGNIFENPELLK